MAPFRLLSIDGGGIRGLIPALVLAHIERQVGRPICDLFEAIAGTSTGGILALGLARPGGDLKTRAAELVDLYRGDGATIFVEDLGRRVFYEVRYSRLRCRLLTVKPMRHMFTPHHN